MSLSQLHSSSPAGLCHPYPQNWEFFDGRCYFFSWTQSDWRSAVSACLLIGAHLVIIESTEEEVGWARSPERLGHIARSRKNLLLPSSAL